MRVCDYIAKRLVDYDIKNVYGIMGGGAAGLNDGFIINKDIKYICFHHEQGAANAALAESKITNKFSVVNPTTGCGGLNCLTSLVSAYQDSNPMLFISGNFRLNYTSNYINKLKNINLRKLGLQEHNIIDTVRSSTKFSHFLEKADDIVEILEKAINVSMSDRKGPCWIDIPSDIQVAKINNNSFPCSLYGDLNSKSCNINCDIVFEYLKNFDRPLVVAGYGIHLSGCRTEFSNFIAKYNIPFVTTFLAKDIIPFENELNLGSIGIKGNRAANFAIQNSNLLIIIGSSLNLSHVGYDHKLFSPRSKKIYINIDRNDFESSEILFDEFIQCDLRDFFKSVI